MLTHLVILLDDSSVSYCYYNNVQERKLISLEDLKTGIVWAMKENLNIQFVYPSYDLPDEYQEAIDGIDNTKIKPMEESFDADVIVVTDWKNEISDDIAESTCIIKASREELNEYSENLNYLLGRAARVNVVFTDSETFTDSDIPFYRNMLEEYADSISDVYQIGKTALLNFLTDRIMLNEMNNCNAGVNNVTLAPNGRFYICPAFYYDNPQNDVGDLKRGLVIKNQKLLQLSHAPICRNCDAYHCRRCVWMNSRLTLDSNTPSHQQCVLSHLERNASLSLQQKLQKKGVRLNPSYEIKEIDYLDPFNIVNKWK